MYKNTASQKLTVYAYTASTGVPITGDAANITAYVAKDNGSLTVLADTSATEVDSTNAKGYYRFDLAQAETNADKLEFSAKSSTSGVYVVGVPAVLFTEPPNFSTLAITSSTGLVTPGSGTITLAQTTTTLTNNTPTAGTITVSPAPTAGTITLVGTTTNLTNNTPTSGTITLVGTTTNLTNNAPTAGTITTTGAVSGNVAGSVGSVVGAVGSVTGAVGSVTGNVGGGTVTVGGYVTGQAPLQPTVAGRTLDVSVGGEAGLDWANIGSKTATNALTGTTVSGGGGGGGSGDTILAFAGLVDNSKAVSADGKFLVLTRDCDYTDTGENALYWAERDGEWPALSGGTVTLTLAAIATPGTAIITKAGEVVTDADGGKLVKVELTSAETAITASVRGYVFSLKATLSSGDVIPLVSNGMCTVLA